MRIAVIDLGTNTCNLLIAELNGNKFDVLHQSKQLVKLGDDKIRTNEISPQAIQRVLEAFEHHQAVIARFDVDTVRVVATSAVRSAVNSVELLNAIKNKYDWPVKIISGEQEAELIFRGVLLALGFFEFYSVILDIGGGSNEVILARNNEMLWNESRPSGIGRVINQFQISDPIHEDEIHQLHDFFSVQHKKGIEKCKENNVKLLIGCSGAFDTVADIIDQVDPGEKQRITQTISLSDFEKVYKRLLNSTREERMNMKGMDMVRVDLIVPAVIFIKQLVSVLGIKKVVQTDFALREGILAEMMEE